MARLGAIVSALYYPTPNRVMDLIAQITHMPIHAPSSQRIILDVCAGQGEAVSILAKAWGLSSYGVELDTNRAAKASEVLDNCLQGSYHQLQLNPDTVSVLFLNPPYDTGEDDGVSSRQEIQFLMDSTEWLAPGGLLIFIPPRPILKNAAFVKFMSSKYVDIRAWSFPEPEVHDFNQVVVTARKADYHHWRSETDAFRDVDNLPVLGERADYVPVFPTWPPVSSIGDSFRLEGINPLTIAPSWENMTHGYGSTQWDVMVGIKGQKVDKPLVAPRPGHQAMLLAAGALDGAEIAYRIPTTNACCLGMPNSAAFCSQCGSRLFTVRLIKGGSEKVTSEIDNDTETLVRERIVSRLSTLDIHTGEYETWRADEETEKTAEWFRDHGEELARTILQTHTPEFDGDLTLFEQKLALLTAPGILPGHTKPEILPLQKEAAAAAAFRWKQGFKSTIICGEMGTGKTTCAVVASELAGHKKTIIVCPSHLVPKWIRECEKITKQKGVAVTAKKLSEVDAFFAATDDEDDDFCIGPTVSASARFLVLSKETAKLGNRWEPRYTTKKVRVQVEKTVVDEDAPVQYSYYSYRSYQPMKKIIVKEWLTVVTCPDCGETQRVADTDTYIVPAQMDQKAQRSCLKCKAPLWQMVPMNAKGTVRFPLAAYINKRYARRYSLVIDECHQYAKASSDQAMAIQDLASAASKILAMTGTLYGGRASSIFYLLYKVDYTFRKMYAFSECDRFVQHHGLFETKYETEDRTSVYGYRRSSKRTGGVVREIPGMSPAMIPLLLPYTVFLKLKDLRLELPPYTETIEVVDHVPAVAQEAGKMMRDVKDILRKHPKVMGQYLMACLGYPDCPEQSESIEDETAEGGRVVLATAKAFDTEVWPKDKRVVEIVTGEKTLGRRCLVYFSQTHKRDARQRVKKALEDAGLKVVVLDSNVPPEKREEWLEKACKEGFDVMLTNGRLVETGMDLLFAKTIIQYGTEYSIPSLRQSIRRSWRLGQNEPIRVIFLAYKGTMQEIALNLIARKMRAAEMVDGDETGGLAQFDEAGANFFVELAQEAVSKVA